ncbi:MAG: hypothetical protein DMF58_16410, partial [Acidobacteria bacterium]
MSVLRSSWTEAGAEERGTKNEEQMKFSRDWLNDYVDLSGLSDEKLGEVLTNIGHAIEAVEKHADDTIFDL